MTGAAATPAARAFLASQPRPVLVKPFDTLAVQELLAELEQAGRRARAAAAWGDLQGLDGESTGSRSLGRLRRS